jgi:hypothetical protein
MKPDIIETTSVLLRRVVDPPLFRLLIKRNDTSWHSDAEINHFMLHFYVHASAFRGSIVFLIFSLVRYKYYDYLSLVNLNLRATQPRPHVTYNPHQSIKPSTQHAKFNGKSQQTSLLDCLMTSFSEASD